MNIKKVLKHAGAELERHGLNQEDAVLLLADILKQNQEYLYTYPERRLISWEIAEFNNHLLRRVQGFPVATIIGNKYFFGRKFKISKDTLVPRPETELLVQVALAHMRKKEFGSILDVGTGSGNIIISIAAQLGDNRFNFVASDLSKKALKIARHNAKTHDTKVKFIESNLLSNIRPAGYDLIVSNLPYLSTDQITERSIQQEPVESLWGGNTGIELYRNLLSQAEPFLAKDGVILLEIDPSQKDEIESLVVKPDIQVASVDFIRDLANNNRVVCLRRS